MDAPSVETGLSQAETAARTPARLRISECFVSRQGEGKLTGKTSAFVRLDGCNLRCWFCDTPYASWTPDGHFRTLDDVLRWIDETETQHVVLTGGEPLLPLQVVPLCERIREGGYHLTIETAGTIDRPVHCDLLSLSPKLERSTPGPKRFPNHHPVMAERWIEAHRRRRWQPEVIHSLISRATEYQIKFVLDVPEECDEIKQAVQELGLPAENIWIMPQAATPEELQQQSTWVQKWAEEAGFQFCDRAQLKWYGAKRGT